ncbi:unnamed protein product [Urochloa humidicola]
MAGSRRRRRHGGRERSPQQGAQLLPLADATLSTREVTIVERPSKNTSGSTSSTSSGPHVCADLLDSLLHEIIILINSLHDFLAFIGTCRSWRASVSSFPSMYTFSFPPLHLEPDGPYFLPHSRVPQNTPDTMHYMGCSFGYLIFTYEEHCLLVDAYTGAKVGTDSWSEYPLNLGRERVHQTLLFKGYIYVIDVLLRLHTIQLTPQFSMQEVDIMWKSLHTLPINPWLVVCSDMLLMVDLTLTFDKELSSSIFEVFRLDFSIEPAKWVKMEKLENHALFVSLDKRNPAFSCMNPERWGGKSNCIYVARLFEDPDETWTVVELGQPMQNSKSTVHGTYYSWTRFPDHSQIGSLWLFPSLIYGGSQ